MAKKLNKAKLKAACKKDECDITKPKDEPCTECEAAQFIRFGNAACVEAEKDDPTGVHKKLGGSSCDELFEKAANDEMPLPDYLNTINKAIPKDNEGWQGILEYAHERKVFDT